MNQFRLDLDATRCAQAHQDAHVGKMLLEAVQQLCTAFQERHDYCIVVPTISNVRANPMPISMSMGAPCSPPWQDLSTTERLAADLLPYSRTKAQYNHPCSVWTRASRANFNSTFELAEALAAEFRYRFDKLHGSEAALNWVKRHRSEALVPDGPLTPYALAMPEKYQYGVRDQA